MSNKPIIYIATLSLITALLFLAGILTGSTGIYSPKVLVDWLHGSNNGILYYRTIRTLAALVIGMALGSSGLAYQYSLRNPLADPYLLGISTGAAFGVVLAILSPIINPSLVYIYGLIWGILAFLIVAGIGAYTRSGPAGLIVAGVSVSYSFFGLIIIIINSFPEATRISFTWLFGTVAYVVRTYLYITLALTIITVLYLWIYSEKIYTLILGDSTAKSLGVDVEKIRIYTLIIASLGAVAAVALAGPVGFIGLAAPWAARLLLGSRFKIVLVASILIGGSATIASDIIVRLLSINGEIPLTAITALFGGPILFYLSKKTGW